MLRRTLTSTRIPAFGRRRMATRAVVRSPSADELQLFALTFACGFLFTSVYLA